MLEKVSSGVTLEAAVSTQSHAIRHQLRTYATQSKIHRTYARAFCPEADGCYLSSN
jgi:hypothetical protein